MAESEVESYIASVGPSFAPIIRRLHELVTSAYPGFDIAIKYRLLMYAVDEDFRSWVCAIGPSKNYVSLRFLYGAYMTDPEGLLRQGTSHLSNLDVTSLDEIDPEVVSAYVREAVERRNEFKAQAGEA